MDYYYYDDQLSEYEMEQAEDYDYVSQTLGEETFVDLYKGCIICIISSTKQVQQYIAILIGCGLLKRVLWEVLRRVRDTKLFYHLISFGCGMLSLWLYVGSTTFYVLIHVLNICSFLRLMTAMNVRRKGLFLCTYTIGCQLISEYLLKEDKYEAIRGPQMVVSMKMISVSFDIQDEKEKYHWFPIIGYLCSPSSLILGPWISFKDYKQDNRLGIKRWQQVLKITFYILLAVIFLNLSNCLLPWLRQLWNGGLLYRTYLDALAVRCSHYFICYLSHATLLVNFPSAHSTSTRKFQVVKPFEIELPHSLSGAIRSWNIPMHLWLKSCIFKRVNFTKYPYMFSMLTTYLVSCLVHGFNYRVHLVLASLGLFSFIENSLRRTLAHVFNACIETNSCRENCKYMYCARRSGVHTRWYTPGLLLVRLVNLIFSLIMIIQLAYLGVMLSTNNSFTSSAADIFHVWSHLKYFGHLLAAAMAMFVLAI